MSIELADGDAFSQTLLVRPLPRRDVWLEGWMHGDYRHSPLLYDRMIEAGLLQGEGSSA